MKKDKLFSKFLISNIGILLLLYLLFSEFIIRKYVLKINNDMKAALIYKNAKSLNTIWGHSQTWEGINNLKGYINLSFGSQNFNEINIKLKNYYKDKKGSKKVILLLPLNAFGDYMDKDIRPVVKDFFLNKRQIRFYMASKYFQRRSFSYIKNYLQNGFTIVPKTNSIINKDGSMTNYENYSKKILNNKFKEKNIMLESIIKDIPKYEFKKNKNYKSLLEIIDYTKKNNIKVCLISTPLNKILRDEMSKYKVFKNIREEYQNISNLNKIVFNDFNNIDFPLDHYSSDSKHLNFKGAKAFTKLIEEYCNE